MKRTLFSLIFSGLLTLSPITMAKTVMDVQGSTIELADNVERVADLWHANNQIVLLLGGANKLVGTTNVIAQNKWFNEVFPAIKNVPVLTNGQTIQLESLLAERPDAVLVSSKTMLAEVERAGLKGVLVSFQNFDGLKKTVQITADVLGGNAPEIAKTYLAELDENIAFVKNRLKDLPSDKKPTVVHIASGNNLLKIDGGKSMIGEWVSLAGGVNALPDQANLVEITLEEIIKVNPDIIIIGSNNAQQAIENVKQDPLWASIQAVKNGKIFANPLGTFAWDRYSAEEALQILWAAKVFHPEKFTDVDMIKKAQNFYQKYYHYPLSPENANQILHGLEPISKSL